MGQMRLPRQNSMFYGLVAVPSTCSSLHQTSRPSSRSVLATELFHAGLRAERSENEKWRMQHLCTLVFHGFCKTTWSHFRIIPKCSCILCSSFMPRLPILDKGWVGGPSGGWTSRSTSSFGLFTTWTSSWCCNHIAATSAILWFWDDCTTIFAE